FMGSLFDIRKISKEELPERVQSILADPNPAIASASERVNIAKKNLKKLQEAGVTIATGTDAGNIGTLHASSMHQELAIMQEAGLSSTEILINSTLNGAKLMGKEKELGSIAPGKLADIVVLDKNPLEDIANYRTINVVMKDGETFDPKELLPPTSEDLVQRQLVAYNAHDLEGFLTVYSKDVKLYNFPNELVLEGIDQMRERYTTRFESPNLYAEIVSRSVMGDHIIDQEKVIGIGSVEVEATAIYHVSDGLIDKVWFIIK
ncbi:MAG: amidohydrolase family protein, partial [Cyclobacteriaceae bacterium]